MATGYEDLLPTKTEDVSGYEDLMVVKPLTATKAKSGGGLGQLLQSAVSLGRSTASLADVTVGGVLPAAAQMVGYPLARLGRSPEEAQAATQRIVSAVDKPFGKMAGVTETPEYQGEAGRQLLDFIGENFQKGAKFIAEKTGLPVSDVENYIGTLSLAAPAVARPTARTIQELAAPALEKAVIGAKMPFEPMMQARRERMSLEDYARGPQIDAAIEAQRLGIALSPENIQSTVGTRTLAAVAGEQGTKAITDVNRNQVRKVAINDLGLPETTQFDSAKPFNDARLKVSKPYVQINQLPTMVAESATLEALEKLRPQKAIIGSNKYAKNINDVIDDAVLKTTEGLTGQELLDNIKTLRQRSQSVYRNKSSGLDALDSAYTNLAIANVLESMIESNIFNPKLLSEFRQARQKMAKTYAYEAATDFNTGIIDVNKLSSVTSKDNTYTGDIASLGKIAGNFPDAFAVKPSKGFADTPRIARASIGGATGVAIGSQFGAGGAALGGLLGTLAGEGAGSLASRIIASPKYQEALALRDARIPVSQVATAAQPIPQGQAIVPYQQEVFDPSVGGPANKLRVVYDENGRPIYKPEQQRQGFTTPQQPPPFGPTVFESQRGLPNEVPRQIYEAQKRAEMAQEFRAAAERKPASGGIEFTFDAAGNLVPVTTSGAGGVLPTALESAIQKMSGQVIEQPSTSYRTQTISPKTGAKPYTRIVKTEGETTFERGVSQAFAMTAEEKIAWSKVKADLAEVVPGMKTLSNESILNRLQDVEWATNAVQKARDKAVAFEQIAARAKTRDAQQQAIANRERMLDLAEQMENTLRVARPDVSGKIQGPKTRAAFREGLLTNPQPPFKMEIRGTNKLLSGD
jgi:hypothetical protein